MENPADHSHAFDHLASRILETKIFIPQVSGEHLPRRRLISKINRGIQRKLVLVAAPAGYGKTTLLAAWAEQSSLPVAWISIDRTENDPTVFLTYLVAAIGTSLHDLHQTVLDKLINPNVFSAQSLITLVINQVSRAETSLVLVIEDFHRINDPQVINAVCYLLEHLPHNLHLIISSRSSLPFPCSRFRATGDLIELLDTDLRFTLDESREYLKATLTQRIDDRTMMILGQRADGWITALKMVAIALQSEADIQKFVAEFSGTDRYIADYLLDEVLLYQPEDIQRFLMSTSILDKVSAPLCRQVTGLINCQEMLEKLESLGLFITPLDNHRIWFRYHHLFSEFLSRRLHQSNPAAAEELHRRAAHWYEKEGSYSEAIKHSSMAKDYEITLKIITQNATDCWISGRIGTLAYWLSTVPHDVLVQEPEVYLLQAWVKFLQGDTKKVEFLLMEADRAIQAVPETCDRDRLSGLRDAIKAAYVSRMSYEEKYLNQALELSRSALQLLPAKDEFWRISVSVTLGQSYLFSGELSAAEENLQYALVTSKKIGFPLATTASFSILAKICIAQGRIDEALQICISAEGEVQEGFGLSEISSSYVLIPHFEILYLRNRLNDAQKIVERILEVGKLDENARFYGEGLLLKARIEIAKKNYRKAKRLLETARRLILENNLYHLEDSCLAFEALVDQRLGQVSLADTWLQVVKGQLSEKIILYREAEYFIMVELLISRQEYSSARSILDRLIRLAQDSGLPLLLTRATVYKSYLLSATGEKTLAHEHLRTALELAESQGNPRIFLDLETPMAILLKQAVKTETASREFLSWLLGNLEPAGIENAADMLLSERERDVLALISQGYTNREISERLCITVNTVKNHVKSIFIKLNVRNRTEAVTTARQQKIIS